MEFLLHHLSNRAVDPVFNMSCGSFDHSFFVEIAPVADTPIPAYSEAFSRYFPKIMAALHYRLQNRCFISIKIYGISFCCMNRAIFIYTSNLYCRSSNINSNILFLFIFILRVFPFCTNSRQGCLIFLCFKVRIICKIIRV